MSFSDKPSASAAPRRVRARTSLKMQAIGFLSRREHSRQELRAKLLEELRKRARDEAALAAAADKAAQVIAEALRGQPANGIDDAFAPPEAFETSSDIPERLHPADAGPGTGVVDATDLELADPEAAVDQLLDWLVANKYLSDTRFVESRVNARSRKQGTLLIKLELSQHGLVMAPEQVAALRATEFARAQALWHRRFGEVASDPRTRAKQGRFLAARGFPADVVRRVVGGEEED